VPVGQVIQSRIDQDDTTSWPRVTDVRGENIHSVSGWIKENNKLSRSDVEVGKVFQNTVGKGESVEISGGAYIEPEKARKLCHACP